MTSTINKELARLLEEIALLYEIKEDKFRARAYHGAAQTLDTLSRDISEIYKKGEKKALKELSGIGAGIAAEIEEYIKTGKIKEHDKMKRDLPVNIEELTAVEGLGPKTVKQLYKELKIKNLKDLEKAAKAGKIEKLEGLGKKTQQNILQGISFVKSSAGRMLLGDTLPYARELIEEIKKIKGVKKVSEAGSLRRRKETIGDVDVLVATEEPEAVLDFVEGLPDVVKTLGRGDTKLSVRLSAGFDIDIRVLSSESYGAALQYFTGSKEHNVHLRKIALSKGYKLNEYGLFKGNPPSHKATKGHGKASDGQGTNYAKGGDECVIYKKLGMACPPPEIRADTGEIEAALRQAQGKPNGLPKLIEYGSLKGDLQIQTDWSDGRHSIEEMAREAKRLGLEYILITDHTKSLAMTGGLDDKEVLKQKEEIKKINKKIPGFTILSGTECDILKDGLMDLKDKTLEKLDVVGASVHSYFNLSKNEQTKRVMTAMQNPHVDILMHPTGRRINKRPPIELDMEKVIETAKETGTILEINAFPERLDLRDEYIRMAVEAGVKMAISTDAHSKEHLPYLEYGTAQARRGWAGPDDIINTLPVEKMLKQIKK